MITNLLYGRPPMDAITRISVRSELARMEHKIVLLTRKTSLLKEFNMHQLYKVDNLHGNAISLGEVDSILSKFAFYNIGCIVQNRYLVVTPSLLKISYNYQNVLFRSNFLLILVIFNLLRVGFGLLSRNKTSIAH